MSSREVIRRVERALEDIRQGRAIILVDDEDRENEGDLVVAASKVTPDSINFMVRHCRGLICLAMAGTEIDRLGLPMMVSANGSPYGTAFTVSIEARTGVTTGISAADRARTIQVAADPSSGPQDIVSPGHIFPLRAREGGVLVRTGQTEGSVDLARLAGLEPSAVICEIMNDDGSMARRPQLEAFAEEHDLMILSVADLIQYRLERESLVSCILSESFETEWEGDWKVKVFKDDTTGAEHLVFVCGTPTLEEPSLVRVQYRIDGFGAFLNEGVDPGVQGIRNAMREIGKHGVGVFVYLERAEMSASALVAKHLGLEHGVVEEREPKEGGLLRQLGIGSQILQKVGVGKMIVLTNRPKTMVGSEAYGLEVIEQRPLSDS